FDCGMDVYRHHVLEVVGSEGALRVPSPWLAWEPEILFERGGGVERLTPPAVDPYAAELDDMAAAISGARGPRLGRADALGQARTIAALYRAAAEGRAVSL